MNMKTLRIKDLEDIDGDHLDTALEAMQLMKPKQRRIMGENRSPRLETR